VWSVKTENKKKTGNELDAQLNQLISKSIMSDEVVDILEAVGLQKPNIGIFYSLSVFLICAKSA
jgi:type I restriction enzyme R subunit